VKEEGVRPTLFPKILVMTRKDFFLCDFFFTILLSLLATRHAVLDV
jgi:hypothetical protein